MAFSVQINTILASSQNCSEKPCIRRILVSILALVTEYGTEQSIQYRLAANQRRSGKCPRTWCTRRDYEQVWDYSESLRLKWTEAMASQETIPGTKRPKFTPAILYVWGSLWLKPSSLSLTLRPLYVKLFPFNIGHSSTPSKSLLKSHFHKQ